MDTHTHRIPASCRHNPPNRQLLYLRLADDPNLEIIYGHFLEHEIMMLAANPASGEAGRLRWREKHPQ
jgi:hypothetical protein